MPRAQIVEIVDDPELRKREPQATQVFRRFFPGAPRVRLYRTRDRRIGFEARVRLATGERARFEEAYAAVMQALGQRRGRPRGQRTVQAKLRLHEPVYRALRLAARRSRTTLSSVVEDLAQRARLV